MADFNDLISQRMQAARPQFQAQSPNMRVPYEVGSTKQGHGELGQALGAPFGVALGRYVDRKFPDLFKTEEEQFAQMKVAYDKAVTMDPEERKAFINKHPMIAKKWNDWATKYPGYFESSEVPGKKGVLIPDIVDQGTLQDEQLDTLKRNMKIWEAKKKAKELGYPLKPEELPKTKSEREAEESESEIALKKEQTESYEEGQKASAQERQFKEEMQPGAVQMQKEQILSQQKEREYYDAMIRRANAESSKIATELQSTPGMTDIEKENAKRYSEQVNRVYDAAVQKDPLQADPERFAQDMIAAANAHTTALAPDAVAHRSMRPIITNTFEQLQRVWERSGSEVNPSNINEKLRVYKLMSDYWRDTFGELYQQDEEGNIQVDESGTPILVAEEYLIHQDYKYSSMLEKMGKEIQDVDDKMSKSKLVRLKRKLGFEKPNLLRLTDKEKEDYSRLQKKIWGEE